MIVRTYCSKHFLRITLIALCLTAAYPPVVASQETKKELDLNCSSPGATSSCASAAAEKEIRQTPGPQAANLPDAPQPQGQSNLPSSSSHPQDENSAVLFLPVATAQRLA
jgi:hypothetical protein